MIFADVAGFAPAPIFVPSLTNGAQIGYTFAMNKKTEGTIRIGVGGWTFEPWRGIFYPDGLPQKSELQYASRKLTAIEINSTYYGSQRPESFAKWREETPDNFVFALKGPRFATNRRILAEAGESVARFFKSGLIELGDKLGPINWQFAATKTFEPDDFAAFLALLPKTINGRAIRHAVEARHDSFRTADFVNLLRKHDVAVVVAGQSEFPLIADLTAPFVYARIMGASRRYKFGYSPSDLKEWVAHARAWSTGKSPVGLPLLTKQASVSQRDVFIFAIAGFKERNPAAAAAMIELLK